MTHPLAGRGIVITRPLHQAAHLAALVSAAGALPLLFPTIAVLDPQDMRPLQAAVERLDQFDLAIFVSPNSADRALQFITAHRELPPQLKLAAIGRASARELERHGAVDVLAPTRFDSEALLDLPELKNVVGKHIVIFRAESGRELLGNTLAARGATVEHVPCYRRVSAESDPLPLLAAWGRSEVHALTASSSESVRNLLELLGTAGRAALDRTPLFVTHPRIAESASALGLKPVVLTSQGDEGLMTGMTQWFDASAGAVYSADVTD